MPHAHSLFCWTCTLQNTHSQTLTLRQLVPPLPHCRLRDDSKVPAANNEANDTTPHATVVAVVVVPNAELVSDGVGEDNTEVPNGAAVSESVNEDNTKVPSGAAVSESVNEDSKEPTASGEAKYATPLSGDEASPKAESVNGDVNEDNNNVAENGEAKDATPQPALEAVPKGETVCG
jgi:hypothetical protein